MIDLQNLASWPLDKVIEAHGFKCENCGMMEVVAYTTISLEEQKRKLTRYAPGHPKFSFLFKKTLRKAVGVYLRGEALYGEIRDQNMAPAGPLG